ncbi:hypothetical protein MMC24_007263 [Lignoscripta atroalba]|nr:hypothetical protein [Lignoscripta atroalba]
MTTRHQRPQTRFAQEPEPDRKIIIAVDFGTTYSGLAWAQTRKPDMQTPIIQWPDATSGGLEGITSDKVPTISEKYNMMGRITNGASRSWFKLDIDPSQRRGTYDLAKNFPDPMASPPGYDTPPEKLVKDYLTALRKHAEQILRYKLPQSALQSTPIEFVITVPAVWSDDAQAKTRACAEQAGMGLGTALHVISEPEAAAMYALDAMDPHNIRVGDTFLLCDAGGGTVDLISYTVSALKPVLKIQEATPGTGSLCGSSFLNRIFQKFVQEKLGNDPGWDEDVLEEAMKRFELVIKRQFRGTSGEEFMVPVPGVRDNARLGVRRGRLRLTGADVKTIFEPVVQEVITLVTGQISATQNSVKAVLLVGGFGQCAYLRDCIRHAVGTANVEVMQSPNGWTAVVRGALMKGLASTSATFASVRISGRSARKHYGLLGAKKFDEALHDSSRRFLHPYWGLYYICTMHWVIEKGDIVQEDKPSRLGYTERRLVSDGRPSDLEMEVYVCSDPSNNGAPMYQDEGVVMLATIKADLSRVPIQSFARSTGADGMLYYEVDFMVEVVFCSAYTRYELVHKGINYGTLAAEYV